MGFWEKLFRKGNTTPTKGKEREMSLGDSAEQFRKGYQEENQLDGIIFGSLDPETARRIYEQNPMTTGSIDYYCSINGRLKGKAFVAAENFGKVRIAFDDGSYCSVDNDRYLGINVLEDERKETIISTANEFSRTIGEGEFDEDLREDAMSLTSSGNGRLNSISCELQPGLLDGYLNGDNAGFVVYKKEKTGEGKNSISGWIECLYTSKEGCKNGARPCVIGLNKDGKRTIIYKLKDGLYEESGAVRGNDGEATLSYEEIMEQAGPIAQFSEEMNKAIQREGIYIPD